jgi:hypothetical protein
MGRPKGLGRPSSEPTRPMPWTVMAPPHREQADGQRLLGHAKIESTVRYLGIEVDDALALSEQVEL